MFKKVSLQFQKPQPQHHDHHIDRDSMIDPVITAGYSRETFIEPTKSTMTVRTADTNSYLAPSYSSISVRSGHSEYEYPQRQTCSYEEQQHDLMIVNSAIAHEHSQQRQKAHNTLSENDTETLIQEGINHHEKGQLEKATQLFRIGAEKGNPIGMFLYGVSLRHGWGCKKNEHIAFQYLQKAAEHAVEDLANITSAVNTSASKGELIMAIYELGVSFRHGWGCKKNKESAVQFFKIAADLGDPDAQNDLAHCYYHGQGVKKDLHLAAKYYRKADKQGQGIMGNSWIWKEKYDHPKSQKN